MDEQGTHEGEELTLPPATVISRRRPKALWGVLAAVAIAAGALAVTSGGDDPSAPALPIALGSAGAGRSAAPMAADSSFAWVTYIAGEGLPALGGEAPAYRLPGAVDEAQVRALAAALGLSGDPVADAGMWTITSDDGATLQVYEGAGASWWFSAASPDAPVRGAGSTGGSAGVEACVESAPNGEIIECSPPTTLAPTPYEVCPDDPASSCPVESVPPETVDCAAVEAGDCPGEVPSPPADLPSEEEARSIALDVLAATGVDTSDAIVTVDGPYDAWYVMVEPRLDGAPSGLLANVAVGSKGAITSAGGFLGTPERLGDYPILDTRATIARLNEQMAAGGFSYGGVGIAEDDTMVNDVARLCAAVPEEVTTVPCDDTVIVLSPPTTYSSCKVQPDGSEICEGGGSTEPGIACPQLGAPEDQPLTGDDVIDCPTVDPVPEPLPAPEPEPMEVVLTGATPTLVLVPANDGSTDAYLVPGYRFTGENEEQVDAPAVADEALTGPTPTEPPVTGTITTDTSLVPDPGGTDGGSTPPSGCEPLAEEDSSGTTHTIQPCAGVDPTDLAVGVGYYVDVDLECGGGTFSLGGRIWRTDDGSLASDEQFEGGTFTLRDQDHGTFVGDAARTKVADFHTLGAAEDIFCSPAPRP